MNDPLINTFTKGAAEQHLLQYVTCVVHIWKTRDIQYTTLYKWGGHNIRNPSQCNSTAPQLQPLISTYFSVTTLDVLYLSCLLSLVVSRQMMRRKVKLSCTCRVQTAEQTYLCDENVCPTCVGVHTVRQWMCVWCACRRCWSCPSSTCSSQWPASCSLTSSEGWWFDTWVTAAAGI